MKFKPGQKVRMTQERLDWHVSHLTWCHGQHVKDDNAYKDGEREIRERAFRDVYFLLHCKLAKKFPTGITGRKGEQNCIWVDFKIKTEVGMLSYSSYFENDSLTLVKKRKK